MNNNTKIFLVLSIFVFAGLSIYALSTRPPVDEEEEEVIIDEEEEEEGPDIHPPGPAAVDGGYGPWSNWVCDKQCGPGTAYSTRQCDSPAPAHGGKECSGPSQKTQPCNEGPCVSEYVKLIKCDGSPPNLNYVFKLDQQVVDPITGSAYFYQQTNGKLYISIQFDPSVFGSKVISSGYYSKLDSCEDVIQNQQADGSLTKGNYVYKLEKATKQEFDQWLAGNRD
jgi:hypothetical protein